MNIRSFLLSLMLVVHASGQVRVINDGFPGENTSELEARLDGALQQFKPDYVVLFAGTNDALNEKKSLPSSETGILLRAMADLIKSHRAQVLLVAVHDPDLSRLMTRHKPEAYGDTTPLARVALVNQQVRRVAQLEHAPVVPFDVVLQKAGGANAEFSTDGVHLTAKGYGLLAGAVRAQLPTNLPRNATILCFGDSLTYGIGVRSADNSSETAETYPAQLRVLLK